MRLFVVTALVLGAAMVTVVGVAGSARTAARATPLLGPPPRVCGPKQKTCCPGGDCTASPFLVQTRIGVPVMSTHVIRVGQRFTITFRSHDPTAHGWTFPTIAQKLTSCRDGIDQACTYLAVPQDVTFPALAHYDGWTTFRYSVGNSQGVGVGYVYYAILGPGVPVTGRLMKANGQGYPRGGNLSPTGQGSDPGMSIAFSQKVHGIDTDMQNAAPVLHTDAHHRYDVGYWGALVKPGVYTISAGDVPRGITCTPARRIVHITHAVTNVDFTCT